MNDAPPAPNTDQLAQLSSQLHEATERTQLFERRYNQELQRGLGVELAGQKAENLCARLQQEADQMRQRIAELEAQLEAATVTIADDQPLSIHHQAQENDQ